MKTTQETYNKMLHDKTDLEHQMQLNVEDIRIAAANKDLSENAAYHAARERQSFLKGKLAKFEKDINEAEIYAAPTLSGRVMLGNTVTVFNFTTGEEEEYTIVGAKEINPAMGLISNTSPIGSALLGKRVGESATVKIPAGFVKLKIMQIE